MKYNIIIGVILTVALIGGGLFLINNSDKEEITGGTDSTPVDTNTTHNEEAESPMVSGKGILRSLLGIGQSQECSFVVRVDSMLQEGTAFYDGGNARIDTMMSGTGLKTPTASYMIMDEGANTMYMWGTAQGKQGIKMKLEPEEAAGEMEESYNDTMANEEAAITPDVDVDYNCKPWKVDGSVFVPPSDVEFMDMSDMQKMMEGFGGMMGQ
jgi:hypothetical protein